MRKKILFALLILSVFYGCLQEKSLIKTYKIWDDKPAPNRGADFRKIQAGGYPYDPDWEKYSYPIGNGYMGANVFGRTDTERIQITEKTLCNVGLYGLGGITNFAEINLDFNHSDPKNYKRELNINEAVLNVSYLSDGVKYSREYFMSYPDNIMAIKLTANKKGKLSFTLRPEIPYTADSVKNKFRSGTVVADGNLLSMVGVVEIPFKVKFEAQIKVLNDGGTIINSNDGEKASITVSDANNAIILLSTGTNYRLNQNIFMADPAEKLDSTLNPHDQVSKLIVNAEKKGYSQLRRDHIKDYQNLFLRAQIDLNSHISDSTTAALLENYKKGNCDRYLEELMFQHARYMLIASSREGTLPTGLQGIWSQYQITPWTGGYWHNINIQMNYWGAFNTNLAETFIPYIEFFNAYYPQATKIATEYLKKTRPDSEIGEDNGWTIGTGNTPYKIGRVGGHSGPGTGGFTTKLFWDYYDFTRDTAFLEQTGYNALLGMSKFLSKTLIQEGDSLLLVSPSASPEQAHNNTHYITTGTTFDQGFVWENHHDLLKAANILGKDDAFLSVVKDEINKLDPIIIGESGQVKEFREEKKYSDIGDPKHRHVSHLCPLYPGTLINSNHPDWMKGVAYTLKERGNNTTGWAMAHRMNLWARLQNGEEAYNVYKLFIQEKTMPNLWTLHPPFQIDGSFGCMAGTAEMLIQSHEDYIQPLAALPKTWNNGSCKGLVARGNFVIDAEWKEGKATLIKIKSAKGGECRIKYEGIANAHLKNASGKSVEFKDENDIITFNTQAGDIISIRF